MVDHQISRLQRINLGGVAAELANRFAHRREVRNHGNSGEVLQQYARRHEGEFAITAPAILVPLSQRLDMRRGHVFAVLAPQDVLEENFYRIWQSRKVEAAPRQRLERIDRVAAAAGRQSGSCAKTVLAHGSASWSSRSYLYSAASLR